jgi:hypothetical protein
MWDLILYPLFLAQEVYTEFAVWLAMVIFLP